MKNAIALHSNIGEKFSAVANILAICVCFCVCKADLLVASTAPFFPRILRRIDRCNCKRHDLASCRSSRRRTYVLKFISTEFSTDPFLLPFSVFFHMFPFFLQKFSRDVNLACLLKTSGEKQTYFAYDLFVGVHAVATDEFLMAYNTEVKLPALVGAGIRTRVRREGSTSVFHHGSRGITSVNKFPPGFPEAE